MKKTSLKKCLLTAVAVGGFMLSSCDVKVTDSSSKQTSSSATTSSSSSSSSESSSSSSVSSVDTVLQNVISLLNALSDSSTEAEVTAARTAYDALTDAQKVSVPAVSLAKLVAQEKRIKDTKDAAAIVVKEINALSETPTKEQYLVVLNKYNSLSDEAKALVTNKDKLDAAGAYVKRMEDVDAVIAAINDLSNTPTEAEYNAVLEKYNALPEADRTLVTNYNKLTAAKDYIDNMKKVNSIITMIDNLGSTPSETDVTAARAAYDSLPEAYKSKVTNYSKLETAEEYVKDFKAASAVMQTINDLGETPSEAAVTAAEEAYNALDTEAKAMVTNYEKLTEAKEYVETIKQIDVVINEISALTNDSEKAAVEKARADYDALPNWAKEKVTNYANLQSVEAHLQLKEKVASFETYVDNIVLANVTEDTINDATSRYDELGEEGQKLVSATAKAKYDEILIQLDVQAANNFAASINTIDAATVTYAKAVEVRTNYNALSTKAKELFNNNEMAKAKYYDIINHIDNEAKALDAELAKLPTEIEDAYLYYAKNNASIKALRESYNSLADEIKGSVSAENLAKLTNIEGMLSGYSTLLGGGDNSYFNTTGDNGYVYVTSTEKTSDEEHGILYSLTLIDGSYASITSTFNSSISSEMFGEYKEIYFYFYNPQSTSIKFRLGSTNVWDEKNSCPVLEANAGWNKFVVKTNGMNVSSIGSLTYTGTVGLWGTAKITTQEGWKISPIYGYKGNVEEDNANIAKINSLIADLPTSLSDATDYVKIQSISKLAYAQTFYEELSLSAKTSFDATDEGTKYATLKSTYDAVGTVIYGINNADTISCQREDVSATFEFDTTSDFALGFGRSMKITIPEATDTTNSNNITFKFDNLSGDYSSYSKFAFATYNTLAVWNQCAVLMWNDGSYVTSGWVDIPGYHEDKTNQYGYGYEVGLVTSSSEYFDKCKGSIKNCTLDYRDTWNENTVANGYLVISPIVALK